MSKCAALTMEVDGVEVVLKVHADEAPAPGDPPGAPKTVAFDFSKLFRIGMCVASCIAAPTQEVNVAGEPTRGHPVGPAARPAR